MIPESSSVQLALRHKAVLRWLGTLPPGERDLIDMYYAREHGMPRNEVDDIPDEYADLDWVWKHYGREIDPVGGA